MIINISDQIVSIHRCTIHLLIGSPVAANDRAFLYPKPKKKGTYVMKFLLIVLAVHFVAEIFSKRKENKGADVMNERVLHPAEFNLRWD